MNVDPDETVSPRSTLFAVLFLILDWNPFFASVDMSKFRMEESIAETQTNKLG